ncbi:MAG: peptidoglycan DD-metalloendopeptidase family protein [Pseudomonadota bacterium]
MLRLAALAALAFMAGCATKSPAPVVERTVAPAKGVAAVPGGAVYHTVKKGETLYSIALEYGHDYREVAAWNNLENPAAIKVGQQLRVSPPAAAAPSPQTPAVEVKPIAGPAVVEARPLGEAAPPVQSENFKREPKGGKLPYSDQALAQVQKGEAPVQAALAKPEAKPETKPESRSAEAVTNEEDGVEWAWPYTGRLLAAFSEGANKGLDIAGKEGDPVLAAASGKVLYVGNNVRGYGNLVIVKHNNTYLSAYAHNSRILVKENQTVARGQKIAELGASDTDQPKLHFEIRRQGKPVDPLKYLPQR